MRTMILCQIACYSMLSYYIGVSAPRERHVNVVEASYKLEDMSLKHLTNYNLNTGKVELCK